MNGKEKDSFAFEDWSEPKEAIGYDLRALILELSKELFLHEHGVISFIRASSPFKHRDIVDKPSLAEYPSQSFTAPVTVKDRRRFVRVSYVVEPGTDKAYIEKIELDAV